MNELFFPVFGPLLILLLVVPLCALAGKAGLAWLDRASTSAAGRFGTLRYLLLVAPPFLPVAWAISAGVHQAESGRSVLSCLVTHDFEELCVEPLLFAGLLSLLVAARVIPELVRTLRASSHRRAGSTAEVERVRRLDPLRYLVLALAVRLNPFGELLLRREAARWIFEREVQCDRAAVLSGAVPFGLARALVQASRPEQAAIAHLGAGSLGKLRLRIELLLSYAEKRPVDDVTRGASALLLVCTVAGLAITLPHVASTSPLDALHVGVERAAAAFLN